MHLNTKIYDKTLLSKIFATGLLLAALSVLVLSGCADTSSPEYAANSGSDAKASDTKSSYKYHEETQEKNTKQPEIFKGLLVSNQPLFLLAQAATAGIEVPKKIMTGGDVGHHYHLKPSDRKDILTASDIFWIGADLEAPLASVLNQHKQAHALLDDAAIKPLPVRDVKGHMRITTTKRADPHIWLDPERAKRIVKRIAKQRAQIFPSQKEAYFQNSATFAKRMDDAVQAIQSVEYKANQHKTKQSHDYIAYHDAYQYIEKPLNLTLMGSVTASPELPVTAQQLIWLQTQKQIRANNKPICVLSESSEAAARLSSLKPMTVIQIDESMQQETDFVVAWQHIANKIWTCSRQVS